MVSLSCGFHTCQHAASRDQRESQKSQKEQKSNSDAFAAASHLTFHLHEFPRVYSGTGCLESLTLPCLLSYFPLEYVEMYTISQRDTCEWPRTWQSTLYHRQIVLNYFRLKITFSLSLCCPHLVLPISNSSFNSNPMKSKYHKSRLFKHKSYLFFLKYQRIQCALRSTAYQESGFCSPHLNFLRFGQHRLQLQLVWCDDFEFGV